MTDQTPDQTVPNTVAELDPTSLSPMQREVNHGLMVAFINAELLTRAGLDVRDSIVLYDQAKVFAYAVAELPDEELLQELRSTGMIHYWSKGC